MKLIVSGFHYRSHFPILEKILLDFHVTYCQIIYDTHRVSCPEFTEAVFLDDQSINTSAEYPVDWNTVTPIDEPLLERMAPCESAVMQMMDRLDAAGEFRSYEKRKLLYDRHLRYWNHVLTERRPDLALFDIVPHQVYDYIVWELCRVRRVPTIVLFQTNISDCTVYFEGLRDFNPDVREAYARLLKVYEGRHLAAHDFEQRTWSFLKAHVNATEDSVPFYTQDYYDAQKALVARLVRKGFRQLIRSPWEFLVRLHRKAQALRRDRQLAMFYDRNSTMPDFHQEFIYVPLHFQPECSTSPLGGAFVDQLLMVRMLAWCAPKDLVIYVKEHPAQDHHARSIEYYQALLDIPKVRLISRRCDGFALIRECRAVATVTGTAGMEALFRGKPVLLFGSIYFEHCRGVHKVKSLEDCAVAMREVLQGDERFSLNDVLVYFKALEQTSIRGYIGAYYGKISHLSVEENNRNLAEAISARIRSVLAADR